MTNLETVQQIYAAFGRGDIPGILDHLAENIEWEYGITSTDIPWLQPRHGRAEVPKFFEALGAFEFHTFQPKTFLESGNVVVALIDVDLTVKATGTRIAEEDETHIWYFNSEGRVSRFAHKVDTHQHWVAFHGEVSQKV
jgi:ketosteroid isomerase-like protein